MNIEIEKVYTRKIVEENPNKLFVYGENEHQKYSSIIGGGQAVIRGMENSFGFRTLTSINKYWKDENYLINVCTIIDDVLTLEMLSKNYDVVVFPHFGLGTGRAYMQYYCPKTFLFLCNILLEKFGYNNLQNLIPKQF